MVQLRLLRLRNVKRCFSSNVPKSSFDVDLVSEDYARRTEFAAANFANKGSTFRMVLPPPNVTGKLHLGHALTVVVEDSFCRHQRIQGNKATWLPGFDHAGIATQSVVERELWKLKGIRRNDLTREEFLANCHEWSQKNANIITSQLNRLGATLDWRNCYYTLDEKFSSAVRQSFSQLHKEGLIFRDKRIVNWCPNLQSSLSDQEVDRVDAPVSGKISIPSHDGGRRNVNVGQMHKVSYKFVDLEGELAVGTTRPETLYADVALAVNPNDSRYNKFVGKRLKHPLVDRIIPVIADEDVKIDKGTGVVKITPSHDALDFQIASRHWDEILAVNANSKDLSCMDAAGRVTVGPHAGHDRFAVRTKVIEDLKRLKSYGELMQHSGAQVSVCGRTGDIVEPRLTEQWFLRTDEMHEQATEAIRTGKIKLIANFHEQKMLDWFSNQDPWCLSRQLDWGHRIPAYTNDGKEWIVTGDSEKAANLLESGLKQDNDVLDTWFSSALIPLITAGWFDGKREKLPEPPLNVMETGWDIQGFWVARMIMLTMRLTNGQIPFPEVVFHGLVRDSSGRKMSKSLGNVIDPLDVVDGIKLDGMLKRLDDSALPLKEIEQGKADMRTKYPEGIPKLGTDALRFALLRHDVLSTDIPLDVHQLALEGSRFCNKLWNVVIYLEQVNSKCYSLKTVDTEHPADKWIMSRLAATLAQSEETGFQVDVYMQERTSHLAFGVMHKFLLNNFCDNYLEMTKKDVWNEDPKRLEEIRSTVVRVLQPSLVQLSAFMPFVSEHLYERAFYREEHSLHFDFVKSSMFKWWRDEDLERSMNCALAVVAVVRSLRQQMELPQNIVFNAILQGPEQEVLELRKVISDLSGVIVEKVISTGQTLPDGYFPSPVPGHDAVLALRIQDTHKAELTARLERLMKKSEDRAKQFEEKANKYKLICERDRGKVKASVIMKNERKETHARQVANNAWAERARVQKILDDVKGDARISESDSS